MKKLLLLFAFAGCFTAHSDAQVKTGMMFNQTVASPAGGQPLSVTEMEKINSSFPINRFPRHVAKRGTTVVTDWYDMWNSNYTSGSSIGYYFAIASDSNVVNTGSSGPYNIWTMGMGMSFDPTDSAYWSLTSDPYLSVPVSAGMSPGQTYTVDSFFASVQYMRNNPTTTVVDSLILEFAVTQSTNASTTSDSGAYNLQYTTPSASFYPISYDETPRFGTIRYNSGCGMKPAPYNAAPYINDCYFDSVFVTKLRYAFALNSTTVADTDANGLLDLYKLKNGSAGAGMDITPLTIDSKHQRVVSFISFKSGVPYTLGTPVASANWIKLFAGEPTGASSWWRQSSSGPSYSGSYQDGLMTTTENRYSDTAFTYPHNKHDVLIPSYAYNSVPGMDVTEQAFHISWTPIPSLAVTNINQTITDVTAYPNPSSSVLNISFTLSQCTNLSVSLINIMGQVVATQRIENTGTGKTTFNTASLPAGVYHYAFKADNGETKTGRVVISH